MPQVESKVEEFSVTEAFGNGRFSNAMKEAYSDTKRLLGLSHGQALKVAKQYGIDLGRQQAEGKITLGNVTKNGTISIKDVSTMKGVVMTYSISMVKACVLLQDVRKYGVTTHEVTIREDFMEWVNKE